MKIILVCTSPWNFHIHPGTYATDSYLSWHSMLISHPKYLNVPPVLFLLGNPGRRELGRPRRRWNNNIKKDLN